MDYRRARLARIEIVPLPAGRGTPTQPLDAAFDALAEAGDEDPVLQIESREIRALRRAGGVVWFDFETLCGGPRSQNDYLEIATQFHTVVLSRRAADGRCAWRRRRADSPGWSTCCTTSASSGDVGRRAAR